MESATLHTDSMIRVAGVVTHDGDASSDRANARNFGPVAFRFAYARSEDSFV